MFCFEPVQCGCDKKNVPVFCMAPAAKGGAASWCLLLISTGEEPVVFPHALICDNKKNFRLCFSNTLWVSLCSDLPVTFSAVCPSTQSRIWGGSGSNPRLVLCWRRPSRTQQSAEPRVLLCFGCSGCCALGVLGAVLCGVSGCSAEGRVLDVVRVLPVSSGTDRFWAPLCDLH